MSLRPGEAGGQPGLGHQIRPDQADSRSTLVQEMCPQVKKKFDFVSESIF
jgi:hypothetical protein